MKLYSYFLTFVFVFNLAGAQVVVGQTQTKDEKRIAKVKAKVREVGVDGKSKMDIKMLDGRLFQGKITQAGDDSFTILEKNGISTSINYADVRKAGYQSMSRGAKVALYGGLAAAAAVPLIILAALYCNEGSC